MIRKGMDGGVYICKQPLEAARFVAIRGHETGTIFEVELEERKIVEAHDHNEAFFGCKAYMYMDDMGFVFHYNRTTLRKSILKRATKKAHRIAKKEKVNWYDASAMLASMGWFTHTDTYGFYEDHIKPYVNIKQLKKKVSKHSKKGVKNNDVRMVSVRKYGQADRVGHDIKPDSGLSAKEHRRADQEGH